jgi:hypothetical protein
MNWDFDSEFPLIIHQAANSRSSEVQSLSSGRFISAHQPQAQQWAP